MKFANASQKPKVYYGLHMAPGVAEYREPGREPYRILIEEKAIKNMNPTFEGCPVYVEHVDDVNLENIQEEADGYVVESFYNKSDGKNWVKFIVVSDRGHEAISRGWKLSNAYIPKEMSSGGGQWHGVDYEKEVMRGEYEHLAIVDNPRYEESVIMTPEQFKAYNNQKEVELTKLSNSKGEFKMKFSLFKKTKVENEKELAATSVILPESKKEVTIEQAIEIADKFENMHGYANGDHMVKAGEEEMTVNEMVNRYCQMMQEKADLELATKEKGEGDVEVDEHQKKNEDDDGDEDDKKKNKEDEEDKHEVETKKKNEADKKAKKKENFEALKNAPAIMLDDSEEHLELSQDKVARGQSRYGSKK